RRPFRGVRRAPEAPRRVGLRRPGPGRPPSTIAALAGGPNRRSVTGILRKSNAVWVGPPTGVRLPEYCGNGTPVRLGPPDRRSVTGILRKSNAGLGLAGGAGCRSRAGAWGTVQRHGRFHSAPGACTAGRAPSL